MKTKPLAIGTFFFSFRILVLLGLTTFLFISQPALAGDDLDDDWMFSASIYAWGAGIEGESAEGDDIDVGFKDILDHLDIAFMGEFGANKGKWGFLTDVIYLNIKDGSNQSLNRILTLSEVEVKAWVVTPMVTYRVIQSDQWTFNLLAGVRYLHLEPSLKIDTPLTTEKTSDSGDTVDGIVGVRGKVNLNHNWYLPFQFNVGTGETKLTWQATGGIGYKLKAFDLIAGYRYMTWNFDDDDKGGGVFNDLTISGPIIGARFQF